MIYPKSDEPEPYVSPKRHGGAVCGVGGKRVQGSKLKVQRKVLA
jgi:hypothetical protein